MLCEKTVLRSLRSLGYENFTPLQQEAFANPEIYEENRNVFVIGETSSGKTMIPLLLYCQAYAETANTGDGAEDRSKMIFAVPYRALAAQKVKEFEAMFGKIGLRPVIRVSTGEHSEYDEDIKNGNVDIAVIITEKIYRFICCNDKMLSRYHYFVVDEIGLLNSDERGGKIDFIFALTYQHQRTRADGSFRIFALGTPYYNWQYYIRNYQFTEVSIPGRPVILKRYPIEFGKKRIIRAPEGSPLRPTLFRTAPRPGDPEAKSLCPATGELCPEHTPARHAADPVCPKLRRACELPIQYLTGGQDTVSEICAMICSWHLERNQQVLIFFNNRERVRELAKQLFLRLEAQLDPGRRLPPEAVCKERFFRMPGLEMIDPEDLVTIFDDIHYRAMMAGVTFHSAALPEDVRAFIENRFLSSKPSLRIVCSTETLAFGINSGVDAVIIADIQKNVDGGTRYLTVNEFQNYAGRAGRLHPNLPASEQFGYVYPLIKVVSDSDLGTIKRRKWWADQETSGFSLTPLHSRLFTDFNPKQGSMIPFYLLTILPMQGSMTMPELVDALTILPHDSETIDDGKIRRLCANALADLSKDRLVSKKAPNRRSRSQETQYSITPRGTHLRGFILGIRDYDALLRALASSVRVGVGGYYLNKLDFLYHLTGIQYLSKDLARTLRHPYTKEELTRIYQALSAEETYQLNLIWDAEKQDNKRMVVWAMLLAWSKSQRVEAIHSLYKLAYPLIQNISKQACYLIEICIEMLPDFLVDRSAGEEVCEKLQRQLYRLRDSLFYGVDQYVYSDVLAYMKETDPSRYEAWKALSVGNDRTLRRIAIRYHFFENAEADEPLSDQAAEERERVRKNYKQDIENISYSLRMFFEEKFGEAFTKP